MDRLFLDANILFSAAYKANARLLELWSLKGVVLCSSRYALGEARSNLLVEEQQRRLEKLSEAVHFRDAGDRKLPPGVSLPEKDAPILLAAIEARADYLLTGDIRHFGAYLGRKVERVEILTPRRYLQIRGRKGGH